MSKCKKCSKTLVGKEKYFCKSCKDTFIENTKQVGKGVMTVAGLVLVVGKGINDFINKNK